MNKQSLFFTFLVAIVTLLIAMNLISILAKKRNINTTNLRNIMAGKTKIDFNDSL